MKIIADKNIPFLKGVVESYGEVVYLAGNEFTKEAIKEADTLIVRTVTHFGKELLEGSKVKLICSATIGYDHIDTEYCDRHGIVWKNAPGCNSGSVQQYVASALITLAQTKSFQYRGKTIGIIGVGNVGKKVAAICRLLGMRVLLNDPIRQELEGGEQFVDLKTIQEEADIITFHTPLSKNGKYPTYHLADESFFKKLKKNPIIINSARGAIIKTSAIKEAITEKNISGAVIDCWENEPDIDLEYVRMVDVATPHIAGYSADGKANATKMSLASLAEFWGFPQEPINSITVPNVEDSLIDYDKIEENKLENIILRTYNPIGDYKRLLENPETFNSQRGNYPLRREYVAYSVENISDKNDDLDTLKELGFIMIVCY